MKYALSDLLDRRSILRLKIERIQDPKRKEVLEKEYQNIDLAVENYVRGGICTIKEIEEWDSQIYSVNKQIWNLEEEIGNLESKLKDEDIQNTEIFQRIGEIALKIRKFNNQRIKIKNNISSKEGGYREIKIYYTSS